MSKLKLLLSLYWQGLKAKLNRFKDRIFRPKQEELRQAIIESNYIILKVKRGHIPSAEEMEVVINTSRNLDEFCIKKSLEGGAEDIQYLSAKLKEIDEFLRNNNDIETYRGLHEALSRSSSAGSDDSSFSIIQDS